jgi:voltage-gated potassium channel
VSLVRFPVPPVAPLRSVLRRMAAALAVLALMVIVVCVDRDGYRDAVDEQVSVLDAVYYATVSLSTTGYGDITPASSTARLVNVLLVTPLRVIFLIILVGTTLEVLTQRTRDQWRLNRWRGSLRDHIVVVGFGTKGRSAVQTLLTHDGQQPEQIVVIDPDPARVEEANCLGVPAVLGDGTRTEVLTQAEIAEATQVVIACHRDDTAVLTTLTVRQLNPRAYIVVAAREGENVPLLRQSGADNIVVSAEAAGRLLALSMLSPATGSVVEDLLEPRRGLELSERPVNPREVGKSPRESRDLVLSVVRDGEMRRFDDPAAGVLRAGDRLVVVRPTDDPS